MTRAWFALLACFSAAASAAPAPALEGTWVAHVPETASALRLEPGGRFEWFFSQGALDLTGEGRWTSEGDGVLLTSEPEVVPPRTTLVGTGRDSQPGLLIRISNPHGRPAGNLDVAGEFDDGERTSGFAQEGEYRFGVEESRRIVAVYVGSRVFGFISERFQVPPGDNVLDFRFDPNDVAKADLSGQRLTLDAAAALRMAWNGLELVYRREDD